MKRIIVYGAGGHAKVVIDALELAGVYEIVGIIDDNSNLARQGFFGYKILGSQEILPQLKASGIEAGIVAIGDNQVRGLLAAKMVAEGYELVNAIHPSAQIARSVKLGYGCVIMANAVINAHASLGDNIIVNTGATVDHDNVLGNCVHLSPGVHLAGWVKVGDYSHLGTGAIVIPDVTIGSNVSIGAGSVVTKDIPDDVVAVGKPTRAIRRKG